VVALVVALASSAVVILVTLMAASRLEAMVAATEEVTVVEWAEACPVVPVAVLREELQEEDREEVPAEVLVSSVDTLAAPLRLEATVEATEEATEAEWAEECPAVPAEGLRGELRAEDREEGPAEVLEFSADTPDTLALTAALRPEATAEVWAEATAGEWALELAVPKLASIFALSPELEKVFCNKLLLRG
jgi:hypothetical protein